MNDVAPYQRVDVEVLYPALARQLELAVARRVSAPMAVIEDACQIAWSRLLGKRRLVARQTAAAWLITTAVNETLRALDRQQRHLSLDCPHERAEVIQLPCRTPGPEQVSELRAHLAEIRELPVRQQRIVWLYGLGYRYDEIAGQTGDTPRTVERQLLRAKRRLRAAAA